MYNILVIGMTGQGKSPFIHQYIKDRKCFVFDVQDEYGQRTKYPGQVPLNLSNNVNAPRARHIQLDEMRFIWECSHKKDTICVFEEATGFFEGKTSEKLRRLMIGKMFTRNNYIFVFHSISSVPPRIMQMINYVILFKTGDENYQVERKFPSLYPYFEKLKTMPKGSKFIIKTIDQ
jgi:hypothetical protein